MDPLKPFEWISMVVQLATKHCSNGITMCVQNQWAFLNGFKWSISRRVNVWCVCSNTMENSLFAEGYY